MRAIALVIAGALTFPGVVAVFSEDVGELKSDAGQISWKCDAPAGSSNKNGISISSPPVIAGTIELESSRGRTQWAPVASFNFRTARGDEHFAGVSFYMRPEDSKNLYVRATGFKRESRDIGTVPQTEPVNVRITVDQKGTLGVETGSLTAMIHGARFQPNIGEVSCSSGQFLFSNLSGSIIDY